MKIKTFDFDSLYHFYDFPKASIDNENKDFDYIHIESKELKSPSSTPKKGKKEKKERYKHLIRMQKLKKERTTKINSNLGFSKKNK